MPLGEALASGAATGRAGQAARGIAPPAPVVGVSGRCPAEGFGGPWGYRDILEAIAGSAHEQRAESGTWVGEDFDPANLDGEGLTSDLSAHAERWSRTPTARRK